MHVTLAGMGDVTVPGYLVWILGGIVVAGFAVGRLFSSRLRNAHESIWKSLTPEGARAGWRLLAFVWSARPDRLGDAVLTAQIWAGRLLAVAFAACIIALYHLAVPH